MEPPASPTASCPQCGRPLGSPLACTHCGAPHPRAPGAFTHFDLLGVPRACDVDLADLRRRFFDLSRELHPDRVGPDRPELRDRSLALTARLNEAYDTLSDPVRRAEYLLGLAGGPSPADDKSVPGDVLGEVLMLREEIEELREAGDPSPLEPLRRRVAEKRSASLTVIADLCRALDAGGQQTRSQLRKELNAIKYWNNLVDELASDA